MDYWLIFFTGLTVGGLTCVTVQGGLLASTIAARAGKNNLHKNRFLNLLLPTSAFLIAKLISYTILGFLLGWLGDTLAFNDMMVITVQLAAGFYMIGVALYFLKVHPIFKYLVPHPPEFLSKMFFKQSESKSLFAPILLGFLTVFIPCGTTLAMEALAMSSGDPWTGALVMGIYVLGTFPLFLALGIAASSAKSVSRGYFYKLAGVLIIFLGLLSINSSLVVLDSPLTAQKLFYSLPFIEKNRAVGTLEGGVQTFNIQVTNSGYEPRFIRVNKNQPVRLNLNTKGAYNCALAFRIPPLKIAKNLKPNSTETVEFTPVKEGKLFFSCSMGMYIGLIEVI